MTVDDQTTSERIKEEEFQRMVFELAPIRDYRNASRHFTKYYKCKEHGFVHYGDVLWLNIDGEEIPHCSICRKPFMRDGDE